MEMFKAWMFKLIHTQCEYNPTLFNSYSKYIHSEWLGHDSQMRGLHKVQKMDLCIEMISCS